MKTRIIVIIVLIAAGAAFFVHRSRVNSEELSVTKADDLRADEFIEPEPQDMVVQVPIEDGSTFGKLMEDAGIGGSLAMELYDASLDVYDLAKIRIGRTIDLTYDKDTDELKQLLYQISTEEELFITREMDTATTTTSTAAWVAERKPIEYEVVVKTSEGVIESSMYQAALDQGIDIRAIIELANAFQWSVDFAMDVREGDRFKFIWEERYRDGEYVMPGQILAGRFDNNGVTYYAFYFEEHDDNIGFFDEEGNSVQKMFLKAPVAFKYISSGFTTGLRYVEAFNVSTGHRAIDYAADSGTPVRAVGDGTVTSAGWNGPYGNFISVRHNGTYRTNYAHLSGYAIKAGQKVKQGQTIGYVGSTGFSTGPHLHYEMVKDGVKINPLHEILPPGEPIADENKERFFNTINAYRETLDE